MIRSLYVKHRHCTCSQSELTVVVLYLKSLLLLFSTMNPLLWVFHFLEPDSRFHDLQCHHFLPQHGHFLFLLLLLFMKKLNVVYSCKATHTHRLFLHERNYPHFHVTRCDVRVWSSTWCLRFHGNKHCHYAGHK